VGSWDKSGRPVIYIDNDVPDKYRESLAIHETVEKYVAEKYHLDPNAEGHEVAEAVEKRWFIKKYGRKEWDEYSKVVERIHRKELSKIGVLS
jgi:nicotinamidase-related amidase